MFVSQQESIERLRKHENRRFKILGSEVTGEEILSVLVKDGLVRRILKSITIDK